MTTKKVLTTNCFIKHVILRRVLGNVKPQNYANFFFSIEIQRKEELKNCLSFGASSSWNKIDGILFGFKSLVRRFRCISVEWSKWKIQTEAFARTWSDWTFSMRIEPKCQMFGVSTVSTTLAPWIPFGKWFRLPSRTGLAGLILKWSSICGAHMQ